MFSVYRILLICVTVHWVKANPLLQGLSFQRGFEINFKPWFKEPLLFIKEKWSPFGVFGKKISIQKRSLDDIIPRNTRPAAPVFEEIEEQPIGTVPLNIVPKAPVYTSLPKVPPPLVPLPKPLPIIVNDYPPSPKDPPISTNMVITQPNKDTNSDLSSVKGNTLYTDISRVESIEKFIRRYEISQSIPPKSIDNTLVKPESLSPSPPLPPKPTVEFTPIPPSLVIENPSTVVISKPVEPVLNTIPDPIPPAPSPTQPPSMPPHPGLEISPPPMAPAIPAPVIPPSSPPLPPPPGLEISPPPIIPVIPANDPPAPSPSLPPSPDFEISPSPIAPIVPVPIAPTTPISIKPVAPTPVLPKEPAPVIEENKETPPPVPQDVPKTDIVLKNNTFVKGSRIALQFGSVFLTLMAQFFDRARATIARMTNSPPESVE